MPNFINKIDKRKIRLFLQSETFQTLNRMFQGQDPKSFVTEATDIIDLINGMKPILKFKIPENYYIFKTITRVEDQEDTDYYYTYKYVFIYNIDDTNYQYLPLFAEGDKYPSYMDVVECLENNSDLAVEKNEVYPALVELVANGLSGAEREEYKKSVSNKIEITRKKTIKSVNRGFANLRNTCENIFSQSGYENE